MGIWAEIKYALNSTLGTSGFKPLDKLIESMIVDHTGLAGGDNIIGVLYQGDYSVTRELQIGKITPNVNGTIRLHLKGRATIDTVGSTPSFQLFIYVDGNIQRYGIYSSDTTNAGSFSQDINVLKGKEYTVSIACGASGSIIRNVSIGAAIADPTLLSYTVV